MDIIINSLYTQK